jgi:hypothetical protein
MSGPVTSLETRHYGCSAHPPCATISIPGSVRRNIAVSLSCLFLSSAIFFVLPGPAFTAGILTRSTSSSSATKPDQASAVCPSKDFDGFLSTFSERADVQKRYTHLPLQYGEYADIAGNRIKWRRIKMMKDIPQFIPETGLVLRSKSQRADKDLSFKIENVAQQRLREVVIFLEDGGYNLRYYFGLMEDCWYLYAIKNAF